eukprot:781149-Karenia_brevis.AAC.1
MLRSGDAMICCAAPMKDSNSQAGHNMLASAYTISTPVKSVKHAGDGSTRIRTYSIPVKSA